MTAKVHEIFQTFKRHFSLLTVCVQHFFNSITFFMFQKNLQSHHNFYFSCRFLNPNYFFKFKLHIIVSVNYVVCIRPSMYIIRWFANLTKFQILKYEYLFSFFNWENKSLIGPTKKKRWQIKLFHYSVSMLWDGFTFWLNFRTVQKM